MLRMQVLEEETYFDAAGFLGRAVGLEGWSMLYRGIIFDFNGVLLWDADWQVQCWQAIAESLRGREMTDDELTAHMHGRPNADVLSYLAGQALEGRELADLIQAKEALYRKLCLMNPSRFVLSPGAQELLDALAKRHISRTIATSSEVTNLEFFIQHLRLDRWFNVDQIVYDDGMRPGKPAPDIYVDAAKKIGVDPPWCVVVEDSLSGLAAAQAAGIGYLVALGPPTTHKTLLQRPGVSQAIQSLYEFPRERLGLKAPRKGRPG